MNRYLCGILLLILSGGLTSCSFHRLVTRRKAATYDKNAVLQSTDTTKTASIPPPATPTAPDTMAKAPVQDTAKMRLIDQLTTIWERKIDFKTFKGKAKVHFESPEDKQEFTADFRVRKDSVIWINVTVLGVSAARILINKDSLFMVSWLPRKEVKRIALKDAVKILPTRVDFASLEHLILGEPLRDGNITDAASSGSSWSLDVEDSNYIQRVTYNKSDTTIRTAQLRTRNPKGPQTMSEFGSYEVIANRKVSTWRVINIQNGDNVYMLDLNFSKEDFDEDLDYPFSFPKNYSEDDK